jgi:hypothetical protein
MIWLLRKTGNLTHVQNVSIAVECAEHVLHIYEAKYPDDKRPRQAIEAAKAWLDNPCDATRNAADAAAYAADAADAAAYAADAAYDAAYAAAYAAYAADAAAYAAAYAAYAADAAAERLWQSDAIRNIVADPWKETR